MSSCRGSPNFAALQKSAYHVEQMSGLFATGEGFGKCVLGVDMLVAGFATARSRILKDGCQERNISCRQNKEKIIMPAKAISSIM